MVGNTCIFDSGYFLLCDYVNMFVNKVKSCQVQAKPDLPDSDQEEGGDNDTPKQLATSGYPTDTNGTRSALCMCHWKAAAADETKQMWGMFDEMGIFVCACRHVQILWLVNMVCSRELYVILTSQIHDVTYHLDSTKYSLVIVTKILKKITSKKLIGYNIRYAFSDTILHTTLKDAFRASSSCFYVNTFHGYSHSYDCQVQHYPNIINGIGLKEMKTLKHIFSASNQLASVTHYMSAYCCILFIHTFFLPMGQ